MSRTLDELSSINRVLDKVETAAQARIAIGEGLNALGRAYQLVGKVPTELGVPILGDHYRFQLDRARVNLETWFNQIQGRGAEDYRADWKLNRWKLDKAYVEIAGIEGAAEYVPRTSNLEILAQALREAPGLFGETVGNVLQEVGKAAGKVAAGAAKGLGWQGSIWAVVIIAVVLVVVTQGGILSVLRGGAKA